MAKLLGIDVGTSGMKALLIDENGTILKQASAEYPLHVPQPGWTEQDPADWEAALRKVLAIIAEPNPDAIGVTGQMHGSVFLDASGKVVRPALLWNDQRTVAECEEIDRVVGPDRVRDITLNPPLTGFQLPKILWLRNHEPEAFARIAHVLLPKDYLRYLLTGELATEVSDASGTGAFDVSRRDWSDELLGALGLRRDMFPSSFESDEVTGTTNGGYGLSAGIPVVGGGGDQAAAAVGTGAVEPGVISVSLGTSGVVFTAIPGPQRDPNLSAHTFCHANRGWHAMGVMLSCGGAIRWLRDSLYPGEEYDRMNLEAAAVSAGADGVTFLPYLAGERCPHNDPRARGGWAGLSLAHGRGHLARAVFEGVSFGLGEMMDLLTSLGATSREVRITGGGAKSALWSQILSDVFGTDCVTLQSDEGPALGAAILAGVGSGVWPDVVQASRSCVKVSQRISPLGVDYSKARKQYRNLYLATRDWNYEIG